MKENYQKDLEWKQKYSIEIGKFRKKRLQNR